MANVIFGTTRFYGPAGSCTFASMSPKALGACAILQRAPRRGLTLRELCEKLHIAQRRQPAFSTGVLQRLISIGAIRHPTRDTSCHRYVLCAWPEIQPT
jgi:hypothetical protein